MLAGRVSKFVFVSLSALVLSLGVTGCDTDDEDPIGVVDASDFTDGVSKDTEGGAFRVALSAGAGLSAGDNRMIVRVGFHDPADPDGPGIGIPGADVQVDGWMPYGDGVASAAPPTYLGDGQYLFESLALPQGGIWQLDMAIAVGETLDESVSFNFVVSE